MHEEDEYELVPLSPLRRMEKRLERVEKSGTGQEMVRELIDVVRTNQQIVDDIVKINSEMINKISDLTAAVNQSMTKMDEFMNRLEVSDEAEAPKTADQITVQPMTPDVEKRLEKLEKRINALLMTAVAKSKMGQNLQKRTTLPPPLKL